MPLTPENELAALIPYPQRLQRQAAAPPPEAAAVVAPRAAMMGPELLVADPRNPKPPDIADHVAMPKLETPFVQAANDTMDYPWYQTLVNIWKLQQPTGVVAGTYFGITINDKGQVTAPTSPETIKGITIESPIIIGDPQAPTPPTADNDTSVATTAFVKNQGYLVTVTLTGDVTGSGGASFGTTVVGLQGRAVSVIAPGPGQVLAWNGAAWAPAPPGIPEAPIDGLRYARQNGAWVPF